MGIIIGNVTKGPILGYQIMNIEKIMYSVLPLVPSWQIIKIIGGSRVVALAALFPFVGYLVIANDSLLDLYSLVVDSLTSPEQQQTVHLSRVKEIYFALVWLSAGVISYKLFCPEEISSFPDRYVFVRHEIEIAEPLRLKFYQKAIPKSKFVRVFWSADMRQTASDAEKIKLDDTISSSGFFPDFEGKPKSKPTWLAESGMEIALCLNTHFDIKNKSKGALRFGTLIAFGTGYFKLSLPAYKVLIMLLVS